MISILLIDDDKDEFIVFYEAIYRLNKSLKCRYANSAASALIILKNFHPTYIYVDLYMPIITGLECIKLIRDLEGCKKIPIVLYSNAIKKEQWKLAKELGATSYLNKTNSISTLVENLLNLFLKLNSSFFD
jgi:CheY-like chemotaxis protein